MTTVRDPHLGSVQDPLIAALLRTSRDVSHVRASTWLRHTVRSHQGLLGHTTKVLGLLLIITCHKDWCLGKTIGLDSRLNTGAAIGELLRDQRALHQAKTRTAELLRDVGVQKTNTVSLLDHIPWVLHGLVIVASDRNNVLARELASELLIGLLVLRELKADVLSSSSLREKTSRSRRQGGPNIGAHKAFGGGQRTRREKRHCLLQTGSVG